MLMLAGVNVLSGSFDQTVGNLNAQSLRIGSGGFGLNGGIASIGSVQVSGNGPLSFGSFSLNDGVLTGTNVFIFNGGVSQSGGQCIVHGGVSVEGEFEDYGPPYIASYSLSNGLLSCESLGVGNVGYFYHSGGTNSVAGNLGIGFITQYELSGGMLGTSNTTLYQAGFIDTGLDTEFIQSGGLHQVTNTLRCEGAYAEYKLQEGTLVASNILLVDGGRLEVGSSPLVVLSNGASFTMWGGSLELTNTVQSLGPLISKQYSYDFNIIQFVSGSSKVTFADSSGQSWDSALYVEGWNGSLSGGGADQLIFGNSANALTPAQLQQFRFYGFPSGYWFAKILPTGEVVPTPVPPLTEVLTATNLVISWPTGNFVLQAATNLAGPFVNIQTSSPYTNNILEFPQRFFRLKQ